MLAYSGVAKTTLQLYNTRHLDVGSFLRRDYSIDAADDTYQVGPNYSLSQVKCLGWSVAQPQ